MLRPLEISKSRVCPLASQSLDVTYSKSTWTSELRGTAVSACVCPTVAEWSDWFDRDDERGSGDWEKLYDLHKAYPDRLCSSPLDIQVNLVYHTHIHVFVLDNLWYDCLSPWVMLRCNTLLEFHSGPSARNWERV